MSLGPFQRAGVAVHRPDSGGHLPDAAVHHRLARVADRPSHRRLARRPGLLPGPVHRQHHRQPRPAHPAGHRHLHRRRRRHSEHPVQRDRAARCCSERCVAMVSVVSFAADPVGAVRAAGRLRCHAARGRCSGSSLVYVVVATVRRVLDRPSADLAELPQRGLNAAFRYALVRLRDAAEAVGFYRGEQVERTQLWRPFRADHRQLPQRSSAGRSRSSAGTGR